MPPLGFCAVTPYPEPESVYSASTAAPQPRQFPVWAKTPPPGLGMGTAFALKDVIAVAWSYGPSQTFDNQLKPYKDAGLDLFVSPGASNWNRIFPNLDTAFINIKNFVRDGQKYGALGMLNTTWDDDGESLFGMTWPAILFGAACSWQSTRETGKAHGSASGDCPFQFWRRLPSTTAQSAIWQPCFPW